MIELGATYSIVGPDGTEAVFNDSTHPNFVGWLREISGLDSPEVRLSVAPLGGADGAYLTSPGYYGARAVTMSGVLAPSNAAEVNRKEEQLRRATDALRGDCTLTWWPAGQNEMQLACRRQEALRISPGRPRQFQLSLVAPDPRIYSVEQVTRIVTWAQDASMSMTVGNAGSAPAPSVLRVRGPILGPELALVSQLSSTETITMVSAQNGVATITTQDSHGFRVGQEIRIFDISEAVDGNSFVTSLPSANSFTIALPGVTIPAAQVSGTVVSRSIAERIRFPSLSLPAGQTLVVDIASKTVSVNGQNGYQYLDFAGSQWWMLPPDSASVVQLRGTQLSPSTELRIEYRHAWM